MFISIIMPVYNAASTLQRSLDSLMNQSFTDFELVCVNDASTDNSLEVIESYIPRASKRGISVHVVTHDKNKGVAAARNTGLDNAQGEFIYWLDSDDFIDADTLELFSQEAKSKGCDIVGCDWKLTFNGNERTVGQANPTNGEELIDFMMDGIMRWNLWLFMTRRSLIEEYNLRFISGCNMGEDLMFMLKAATVSHGVSIIHKPLYHYIQTNSSALTKGWSTEYKNQISANLREAEKFIYAAKGKVRYAEKMMHLKLSLKLPLLISSRIEDYKAWEEWFPESNQFAGTNKNQPIYTRFVQAAARKKYYLLLKLYHLLVTKLIYGVIYK